MRHVDEGTLHAWLDAQITDPAEVAWVEEHLRWCATCATRLAEERATFEQANNLLAITAPATAPGFQDVLAKADARSAETAESASMPRTPHNRRWLLQAGWAASLIFAVGIGWLVRDASEGDNARSLQAVVAERVSEAPSNQAADAAGPAQEAASGSRAAQPVDTQAARQAESPAPTRSREESAVAAAPPVVAPPGIAAPPSVAASPGGAEPAAPFALAPTAPSTALAQAAADSAGRVAAPPLGPARLPGTSPDARVEARAERAAVTAERSVANVAATLPAPATVASPIEWRTVPRTEAAVRSGMPLYGIDGIEPVVTTVRTDGRAVRTTYRLESGVTVELEQERAPFGALSVLPSVESTRRALAPGAGAPSPLDGATKPRVWFETRGTVRVSLRTISDVAELSALGARLRIE